MPCYYPRPGWRLANGGHSLREPVGAERDAARYAPVPCGGCIGCRVRRSRDWAIRCSLEASEHDESCWVTLTYDDDHHPPDGLLVKEHLQGFIKRFRARLAPRTIRFFACGEYGERTRRPHYHAILFGVRNSPQVQDCWPFGFAREDPLTPQAISYVAGYVGKKIGDPSRAPRYAPVWFRREDRKLPRSRRPVYRRLDEEYCVSEDTGEVVAAVECYEAWVRAPAPDEPFLVMSRRPGIGGASRALGRQWRESAIWRGTPVPVPRYLHDGWAVNASEIEKLELEEKKRADMTRRLQQETRYPVEVLRAGEANARALLALKSEARSL